jgi:hypothetical protein
MAAADGKNYKTEAANREGLLRIIMSVPSPKTEPFRLWLAQVGNEHIERKQNASNRQMTPSVFSQIFLLLPSF